MERTIKISAPDIAHRYSAQVWDLAFDITLFKPSDIDGIDDRCYYTISDIAKPERTIKIPYDDPRYIELFERLGSVFNFCFRECRLNQ